MSREREYAVFGAQPAAQNYVNRCNTALGYPKPGTTTYAQPEEREDGKWVVLLKNGIDGIVQGGGAPQKEITNRDVNGKRMNAEIAAAALAPPSTVQVQGQGAQSGIVERPGAQKAKAG